MTKSNHIYDVIILGTGFAGSVLGTILAKHGKKVLMIERQTHPRFAIGESTVPQTSLMMRIMSIRYGIPELDHVTSFLRIQKNVTSSCGVKRNFGFVYHRQGEMQHPAEANQVGASQGADSESHLLRQDIDAHCFYTAIRYGAETRQNTDIVEIEIDGSGVRVQDSRGNVFRGRYLLDGTGHGSILARKYDLRENPSRLKTHSRSLFTHMIGVKPYDDCVEPPGAHNMPSRWHQGTLHHIFDGGWLWVIPFDNHEGATNQLCSVGLQLDSRRFPKAADKTPEEEFFSFLEGHPSMAKQFEKARAVRDWVSTGRMQFSSRACFGDRFGLLSHAAGFIDPLFSRGLANTNDTNSLMAKTLLEALEDDDFSAERFAHIEELGQKLIDYNDRVVNCSYISFRDFQLWNAWYRIWVLGAFLGTFRIQRAKMRYDETGDIRFLESLDEAPFPGSLCPNHEGYNILFDTAASIVESVEAGDMSSGAAALEIFRLLREIDFAPPVYPFTDPEQRYSIADQNAVRRVIEWVNTKAPEEIRRLYFDVETHAWL